MVKDVLTVGRVIASHGSDRLVPWDLGGASKIRGRKREKVYLMLTRLENVYTMGPFVKVLLTQPTHSG